jgi:RHS repeat-associated protein
MAYYGFTGASYDSYIKLIFLRARYYHAADGRFQSRDTWGRDANRLMLYNKWQYVYQDFRSTALFHVTLSVSDTPWHCPPGQVCAARQCGEGLYP